MTPWRTLLTLAAAVSTAPGAFAMNLSDLALPTASKGVHLVAYNSTVYRIQTGLNQLGYDAGSADGVMGARTSSAIRAYERDNGLLVTGQSGLSLLDHIEISIDRRRSAQTQELQPTQQVVPATTSASRSTVIGIQSELRRRGFDVPVISGAVDERTRAAIRSYQGLAGLPVTGQASEALLAHMSDRAATTTTFSQRDLLKRIQTALIERGYDPGPADGGMGPKTRSAIQTYQSDAGLPITGEASTSLLARLEDTTTTTTTTLSQRELTRRTQAALIERGYDPGLANGNVSSKTRLAIQTYQSDAGLPITGEPTTSLLARLEDSNTTTTISRRDLTSRTQAALIERGYDPGPVNGNVTSKTRLAIETYQADSGLQVTGEPSTDLLVQLEDPNTMVPQSDDSWSDDLGGQAVETVRYDLVRRFHDRFRDGDFTRDPAWSVVAGNFFVEKGVLRTTIEPRVASSDDVGETILQGILQGALGVPTQTREYAQIASATRVDNAFHIVVKMSSKRDTGRLMFGVYGGGTNDGYRLAYASADRPTFELLSAKSGNVRVVGTSSTMINLEDGNSHVIEWFRLPDGEMIVNVDDREVMRVRDKGHMQSFDGITIVNAGGDYGIGEVVIDAVVPAKS